MVNLVFFSGFDYESTETLAIFFNFGSAWAKILKFAEVSALSKIKFFNLLNNIAKLMK